MEYYVLDVELCGPRRGKYALADVQVARVSDFGKNDTTFFARSHLGNILNAGDHALGFDLSKANFNNDAFEALNHNGLPDVILVKKSYPIRRARNRGRAWRLKHLAKEVEDGMAPRKQEQERVEQDLELFLRDLEEDPELRSTVNLYKHANKPKKDAIMGESSDMVDAPEQGHADVHMGEDADHDGEEGEEEEEDFPEIRLEELLDDLRIDDGPEAEENQI